MNRQALLFLSVTILLSSLTPFTSSTHIMGKRAVQNSSIAQADGNQTTPKYGGTLRIGGWQPWAIDILHPFDTVTSKLPIFNSLYRLNASGLPTSELAWAWNISEDGLNYTFRLLQNITWHDGFEFNASDVEFTFNSLIQFPEGERGYWDTFTRGISSVKILDSFTIVIHYSNSSAPALSYIQRVPIVPKHTLEGTDFFEWFSFSNPIGTGPFRFSEWSPGINLTLTANNDYFLGRPYLDAIFYRWDVPPIQLPEVLMNNEIDVISISMDPEIIAIMEEIPGISTISWQPLAFQYVGLSLLDPIISKIKVRQALAHAINKSYIVESIYLGYGLPAHGPIPPSMEYWHYPNVTQFNFNTSRAEELLDEAGYPRNLETGYRFNLSMKVGDWEYLRANASALICNWLQQIGINATLQLLSWAEFSHDFWARDFDLIHAGWGLASDPNQMPLWHSTGTYNVWGYNNSVVDALLEEGITTPNITRRREIYQEIQEILAIDLPNLFIIFDTHLAAYNNDFHGFESTAYHYGIGFQSSEEIWYDPTLSGQGKSPVKVCFIDQQRRRTGWFDGSVVKEIPNSTYNEEVNVVKIRSPQSGVYEVEVTGTGNGWYSLEVVNIALDYKDVEIPEAYIREGEVHRYQVYVFDEETYFADNPVVAEIGETPTAAPTTMVVRRYGEPLISMYVGGSHVVVPAHGFSAGDYDTKQGSHYITR